MKKSNTHWSDDELFNFCEDEEEVLKFDDNKEDEFACEELEEDDQPVVLRRARTARKAKTEDSNEELDECINDDTPCQKCNLYTNPEWILLCDNCDLGWHTTCLMPKLYIIPDGDWYCPRCENEQLLTKLRFEYENYISNLDKRKREQLRKERLKYVEINIGNILNEDSSNRKKKARKKYNEEFDTDLDDSDLDDEDDESASDRSSNFDSDNSSTRMYRSRKKYSSNRRNKNSTYERRRSRPLPRPKVQRKRRKSYSDDNSNSDETNSSEDDDQSSNSSLPKQRSARKRVSYQFKEYDELINSAIQASDYDEYAEIDEEQDEEEEDSDDGKSPYSKGKLKRLLNEMFN